MRAVGSRSSANWQKPNAVQRAWPWCSAFHGKAVRIDDLRASLGSGRDGTTALSLLNVARDHGLRGRGVRIEIDNLRYLQPASILHWGFNHFVVLERVVRDGVQIVDPAFGRRSIAMNELRQSFTGVVRSARAW